MELSTYQFKNLIAAKSNNEDILLAHAKKEKHKNTKYSFLFTLNVKTHVHCPSSSKNNYEPS